MSEMYRLYAQIADGMCPACGSRNGFVKEPLRVGVRGYLSRNVFCRNIACRQGYNVSPVGIAHEIDRPTPAEHLAIVEKDYVEQQRAGHVDDLRPPDRPPG